MTNWRYFAVPGEKNYSYVLFGSFFVYRVNERDVSITRDWKISRKEPECSFSACFHLRVREGVHSLHVSSSYRPQKDVKLSLPHCPLFSCFTCHSCDGVIKIWDRDKTLLREIIMDETLTVASFLNQRGKSYFFTPNTLLKLLALICVNASLGDLQCPAIQLTFWAWVCRALETSTSYCVNSWFDTKFSSFISLLTPLRNSSYRSYRRS